MSLTSEEKSLLSYIEKDLTNDVIADAYDEDTLIFYATLVEGEQETFLRIIDHLSLDQVTQMFVKLLRAEIDTLKLRRAAIAIYKKLMPKVVGYERDGTVEIIRQVQNVLTYLRGLRLDLTNVKPSYRGEYTIQFWDIFKETKFKDSDEKWKAMNALFRLEEEDDEDLKFLEYPLDGDFRIHTDPAVVMTLKEVVEVRKTFKKYEGRSYPRASYSIHGGSEFDGQYFDYRTGIPDFDNAPKALLRFPWVEVAAVLFKPSGWAESGAQFIGNYVIKLFARLNLRNLKMEDVEEIQERHAAYVRDFVKKD